MKLLEKLGHWYKLKMQLDEVKVEEARLRKEIFDACFEAPKEGTNTMDLGDGHHLKGIHSINRKVDEAAFQSIRQPFFEEFGSSADDCVRAKLEVSISNYRQMTEEEQKFFDRALIVSPGSPQLKIVKPATRGKRK